MDNSRINLLIFLQPGSAYKGYKLGFRFLDERKPELSD
jgi:hypothetical protein